MTELSNEIKQLLNSQMSTTDFQNLLNKVLGTKFLEEANEEQIKSLLKDSGLIDRLTEQIAKSTKPIDLKEPTKIDLKEPTNIDLFTDPIEIQGNQYGKRFLMIKVGSGKAFLSHQEVEESPNSSIYLEIQFLQFRATSKLVMSNTEPNFHQTWTIELPSSELLNLLQIKDKLHLVCIRQQLKSKEIIGTALVDWRYALSYGKCSKLIELHDLENPHIVTGLVEFGMAFGPDYRDFERYLCKSTLSEQELNDQIQQEMKVQRDWDRKFFKYAKEWWNEFLLIREDHSNRLIKIFVCREGNSNERDPVMSLCQPLKCNLPTPRHAARFVALIPFERSNGIGESKMQVWKDLHSFVVLGKGDVEDHALLLCRLLLGFSLNAYVVCGIDKKQLPHLWVMTVHKDSVIFWEPLTGARYNITNGQQAPPSIPYHRIGCCFNHQSLYANIQTTDLVDQCKFDFSNSKQWKCMIYDCPFVNQEFPFLKATLEPCVNEELESGLKALIKSYREDHGRIGPIHWDDQPSVLDQLIWEQEMAKVWHGPKAKNLVSDQDLFQSSVHHLTPQGFTFKAYPMGFQHHDVHRMFSTLLGHDACREIILTRGDQVKFSVKCNSFCYMESSISTWIALAVRYRQIN